MPRLTDSYAYANGYGFVSDYLAEVFHRLRRHNMGTVVDEHVEMETDSDRSKTAISKTLSGLLKLLYPDAISEAPDAEGLESILQLAVSTRKMVVEQLSAMLPGEYSPDGLSARVR